MLTYNNHLKRLVLPEYGRNIQNMVDHCLTIEDRQERNAAANRVFDAMLTLFPSNGDAEEYRRKLWDHIWIMSGFSLDVDYPFEHVDVKVFTDKPEPLRPERPGLTPFSRYGQHIPHLIETAMVMENGEDRDALVLMIANQMKKVLVETSPDGTAEDMRVFADLRTMSKGVFTLTPDVLKLADYKPTPAAPGKKKKKK